MDGINGLTALDGKEDESLYCGWLQWQRSLQANGEDWQGVQGTYLVYEVLQGVPCRTQ